MTRTKTKVKVTRCFIYLLKMSKIDALEFTWVDVTLSLALFSFSLIHFNSTLEDVKWEIEDAIN